MYTGKPFSPADAGESESYTFNFEKHLEAGETITGAEWFIVVQEGAPDGNVAQRFVGPPVNVTPRTTQRIEGLLPSRIYRVTAYVTTSLSNTRSLWSTITVSDPR